MRNPPPGLGQDLDRGRTSLGGTIIDVFVNRMIPIARGF
jgi:hypothetical protein